MAHSGGGSPPRQRATGSSQPGSPQPAALSKRDKRRSMLTDRLDDMRSSFSSNLRPHYEAQANAIQIDIGMITRANPYENKPLEDDPEEIQKQILMLAGNKIPAEPVAQRDFIASAGKHYTRFAHRVNNAMEARDVALTALANNYESKRRQFQERRDFEVRVAEEEHAILEDTLRQRMIQNLMQKKARLEKEKEQLDLGDSNASLLHPNQFSITNPASPGGVHKRSTRNTGRRGGDPDDSGNVAPQDNRRKKKLFDEMEGQSPGPSNLRTDSTSSPWKDAKARAVYDQYEAPTYSIERLFTSKELEMTERRAAIAANNFLIKMKNQKNGHTNGGDTNGRQANSDEGGTGPNGANDVDMDDDATGADMERGQSQTYHQTRGATKNALSDLAAAASLDFPMSGTFPTYIPPVIGKTNGAVNTIPLLTASDVEADLLSMQGEGNDTSSFERTGAPSAAGYHRRAAPSLGEDGFHSSLPAMGGVMMSMQNSMAGAGDGRGGTPMSRQTSAMGSGVGMKRTASGTGSLLGVPENGRRVRSRIG